MLSLTRQIRLSIDPLADAPLPVRSGLAGNSCETAAYYFELDVTVAGRPEEKSQYLLNIREIDDRVRYHAWPLLRDALRRGDFAPARVLLTLHQRLAPLWPQVTLLALRLRLNPYLSYMLPTKELPMLRLCQRFEFSAAHRLHNPSLSDAENESLFGKCNNAEGHGHNYEFEVETRGNLGGNGQIMPHAEFDRLVRETVLDRFDHKHLNRQTAEFARVIPSVENIARVIHGLLKPRLPAGVELARVTVWETPKTSATCCE